MSPFPGYHQRKQAEIIEKIAQKSWSDNKRVLSTVSSVKNFEADPRRCLTSVFFPDRKTANLITRELVEPLREVEPRHCYFSPSSLHITLKSVRVVDYPPSFDQETIRRAKLVFSSVVPKHKSFSASFYKLVLFPNSLGIFGTTDKEFDNLWLDLDKDLKRAGIGDDKKYLNNRFFVANITLARLQS